MEKNQKMGDGECCPEGEICEVEEVKPEIDPIDVKNATQHYVNPMAVPYTQSEHLKELIAKKKERDENARLKIVQKQR